MMKSLISIIIPVYNIDEYLRICLDSVAKQTYKNLEIILVDDGSTDLSGEICDEYASIDSRIKVVHKKNGGLSDARNVGLDICTGEYIGFVDSDDYIDENMYKKLYEAAEKNDADMVACRMIRVINGNKISESKFEDKIFTDKESMIRHVFTGGARTVSPCVKIVKRNVMENIRFPKGQNWEDAYIIIDIINNTSKMIILGEALYYYRMRLGSITQILHWNKHMWDGIITYHHIYDVVERNFPQLLDIAKHRLYWSYRANIASAVSCADWKEHYREIEEKRTWIRGKVYDAMINPFTSFVGKMDVILVAFLPLSIYALLRKLL